MSAWTRIVFEPGDGKTVADIEDALAAVDEDAETERRDGRLVWKETRSFELETIRHLDVPAAYILVTRNEDTAGTGSWYLFEPLDGEYVLIDAKTGGEHRYGLDAFDYLWLEHGIEGVW